MAEKLCPLYKEPCLEHRCRWYIQMMGTHPQTAAQISEWGCAVEWLPVLLVENAKEIRQTASAVESARNEGSRNSKDVAEGLRSIANAARSMNQPARVLDMNEDDPVRETTSGE